MGASTKRSEYAGPATLGEILEHHLEMGTMTRSQVQLAARCSHTTVGRWVLGDTEPSWTQICLMLQQLPAAVVRQMAGLLLHRTGYGVICCELPDRAALDRNRDGRVDVHDTVGWVLSGQAEGIELLQAVEASILGAGLTPARLIELRDRCNRIQQSLEHALAAAERDGRGQ